MLLNAKQSTILLAVDGRSRYPFGDVCWLMLLSISWQEHHTNDSILTELGLERELMGRLAKLKLQYFGHITRGSAGQLALTVLEGIMEGLRHQGKTMDTRH